METEVDTLEEIAQRLASYLPRQAIINLTDEVIGAGRTLLEKVLGKASIQPIVYCRALVACCGIDIFGEKAVRRAVLHAAPEESIETLYNIASQGEARKVASRRGRIERCVKKSWVRGGFWSRMFCAVLEFPMDCARKGEGKKRLQSVETFRRRLELNDLHDYQKEVYDGLTVFLEGKGARASTRVMVSLPTGSGKTRVVVECLLDALQEGRLRGCILWVAQTEELCEQAVQAMGDVWNGRAECPPRDLAVQRVWGGLSAEVDLTADAIVCTPESFNSKLREFSSNDEGLKEDAVANQVGVVVIDEAHLSLANEYKNLFDLGDVCRRLIGLTATPGKANDDDARRLAKRYQLNILTPASLGSEPIASLTTRRVLAKALFNQIAVEDEVVSLTNDEIEFFQRFKDYKGSVLTRLGKSEKRNARIVWELSAIPNDAGQVLVFASSVSSARWLAGVLGAIGRSAAVVDAAASKVSRSHAIESFRRGETQFMLNYAVLAQGFDAPKVSYVVIARPVNSIVLVEQMLGRGLRGPLNGGTETCRILVFEDQFSDAKYQPGGYAKFMHYWQSWGA